MKVVKVTKHSRNSTKEFFFIAHPPYDDAQLEDESKELCERDGAGHSYGYTGEWDFVEDTEIINRVLKGEIKKIEDKIEELSDTRARIEKLKIEREELEKFLITR